MLEKDRPLVDPMMLCALEPITYDKESLHCQQDYWTWSIACLEIKDHGIPFFITAYSLYQKLVKDPIQLQAKPLT